MESSTSGCKGFKSHFIRGKHTTYETHTVPAAEQGKIYVLVNETKVPTLPVGDCMHTVIQYVNRSPNVPLSTLPPLLLLFGERRSFHRKGAKEGLQ